MLLLRDFAWLQSSSNATSAANNTNTTTGQGVLQQRLGDRLPVHFVNSALVCHQPLTACTGTPCLLSRYAAMDPDTAAGYVPAAPASDDPGRSYGVSVVLPAMLGSVGQ